MVPDPYRAVQLSTAVQQGVKEGERGGGEGRGGRGGEGRRR